MTPAKPPHSFDQLVTALRVLAILTAVLVVGLVGLGVKIYVDASATHQALCALRGDLERRVESSRDILEKHPNGVLGISPADIRLSIKNQNATISTLSNLSCD